VNFFYFHLTYVYIYWTLTLCLWHILFTQTICSWIYNAFQHWLGYLQQSLTSVPGFTRTGIFTLQATDCFLPWANCAVKVKQAKRSINYYGESLPLLVVLEPLTLRLQGRCSYHWVDHVYFLQNILHHSIT